VLEVRLPVSGATAWLLTSRDAVVAALTSRGMRIDVPKEFGTTGNAERDPRDFNRLNAPEVTRIKRIIVPLLSKQTVAARRARAELIADTAAHEFSPPDDAVSYIRRAVARLVSPDTGIPAEDWDNVAQAVGAGLGIITSDGDRSRIRTVWATVYDYIDGMCARYRRQADDGSVFGDVWQALRREGYSEDARLHVLATLTSGYATPADVIIGCAATLLERPDLVAIWRAVPPLRTAITAELLRARWHFGLAAPRQVLPDGEPVSLAPGVVAEPGQVVIPSVTAALRSPESAPNSDQIDIFQHARRHLAFGVGANACPAMEIGMMWLVAVLNPLLLRWPDLRLDTSAADLAWPQSLMPVPDRLTVTTQRSASLKAQTCPHGFAGHVSDHAHHAEVASPGAGSI
jgi:cytochrome P450